MNLLGLQNNMNSVQGMNKVSPVSPVRQAPQGNPQTEAPEKVAPKYDSYTPSQEGLDYLESMATTSDLVVGDEPEVDNMDGTYGSPTVMPEIDQAPEAAIPEELIDPTDASNMETYDPEAWLKAYRDEKANPNPNEIGPGSAGSTSTPEVNPEPEVADPEATTPTEPDASAPEVTTPAEPEVADPTDPENTETYDPSAWLAQYRETADAESSSANTSASATPNVNTDEDSSESFDLQAFLAESDAVASDVTALLGDNATGFSDTQSWMGLLQSSRVY
ncbi:MAG: hypothetical protein R3Y63_03380 [Eubacteriales bacterium]